MRRLGDGRPARRHAPSTEGLLGCAVDVVELGSLKERMRGEVVPQAAPL
ncbi:MAG: hypothetical protein ACRDZ9_00590 [Acidimicrobiales bacterium]